MLACIVNQTRRVGGALLCVLLLGWCGWAVEVNVLSAAKEGAPGAFVTHVFAVLNASDTAETYDLEFEAPAGWGLLGAPTSIALQPGEESTLFVTVTLPPGAAAGAYTIGLVVTAQSDSIDSASATAEVTVTPSNDVELLSPTGASVPPGGSLTYEFTIINRGNAQDSFTVSATSSRGIPVSLSRSNVDLAPQERVAFTVQLSVPIGTDPGRDVLTVLAESSLYDAVESDAVVFTTILPPAPDAVGGTVMEELPARIRLSMDKDVLTGEFDSQLTFSTSGQILGGYFSSFFSLLDPLGPSLTEISSFTLLYRRAPTTFSIGSVSRTLTDLTRLSCTGGLLAVDGDFIDMSIIGGGNDNETRFAGHLAVGPDVANVGIGYWTIRDPLSTTQTIWTATAHAEPLEDWTLTVEGSLGLDGPLTSRAFFFNTTLDSSGYFFNGSAFSVGTYFPGERADSAGIEVSQRLRLDSFSLSASLLHEWDNVIRDPLQPTRIVDDLGFNMTATPLEDGPTLSSTIDFTWDRYADETQKSDLTTLLAVSLTETSGVFPYSLTGKVLENIDNVTGAHVRTTTTTEGVGLSVDAFYLFLELTQEQSYDVIADALLDAEADVSFRFRPETALHEASITLRNTLDDFDLSGSLFIRFNDDLDIIFDGSISWDRHDASDISFGWGIAFNANVTLPLPFLVTKGRLEGRAFIDRDGDGRYGLNDEPASAIVVSAGPTEVSTDDEGYFRFPPLYPDTLTLSASQLPPEARVGAPQDVAIFAGETRWIDIPLLPVTLVRGEVFEDIDRDGIRDSNEGGYAQIRVILTAADGTSVDATTDIAGTFVFADVLPGTYVLSLDADSLPDRFEMTTADSATLVVGADAPPPTSFGGTIREREVIITFQPPTADFLFEPAEPVAGEMVTFDGSFSFDFDGQIVSYAWDFDGDGQPDATEAIVSFTFPAAGTYDIALTVVDDAGNEDTIITSVTVSGETTIRPSTSLQPPVADFSYMPAQPQTGETILFNGTSSSDFDGQIISFAWDFNGDGVIDSMESIGSIVYSSPGSYAVSLTVTDDGGNTDSVTYTVIVGGEEQAPTPPSTTTQLPIADFQISPAEPAPGQRVLLNGTSSLDLGGSIVEFSWDFNEDGIVDATAPIVETQFDAPGTYSVSLTVTDNDGNTDTISQNIVVSGEAQPVPQPEPPVVQDPIDPGFPVADFAYLPAEPEPGDLILFNATLSSDSDGQVVAYEWDFDGYGTVDARAAIIDYRFEEDGVYPVTLIVTDDAGNSGTVTKQLVIGDGETAPEPAPTLLPPVADFTFSPLEPQSGSLVLFNGTLSSDPNGTVASYGWDFDDDGIVDSTAAISEYTFLTSGTVVVSLVVTDDDGLADTLSREIAIMLPTPAPPPATSLSPIANFEVSPEFPSAGVLTLFNGLLSSDPDGDIVSYAWDFDGDGQVDAESGFAEFTYVASGTYSVSLTVTDETGNTDTYIQALLVGSDTAPPATPPSSFQPPVADFSYMPAQPSVGELVLFNGTFSWDFDGEIESYAWDFDGDSIPDAVTPTAEHIFTSSGTKTVSLTVTDDSGASDTLSIDIDVN